jgi:carbon storage regulator
MLVLGRRVGESIFIGDDIIVTILSNREGQIRVGIDAPKKTRILREELKPYPSSNICTEYKQAENVKRTRVLVKF